MRLTDTTGGQFSLTSAEYESIKSIFSRPPPQDEDEQNCGLIYTPDMDNITAFVNNANAAAVGQAPRPAWLVHAPTGGLLLADGLIRDVVAHIGAVCAAHVENTVTVEDSRQLLQVGALTALIATDKWMQANMAGVRAPRGPLFTVRAAQRGDKPSGLSFEVWHLALGGIPIFA